MELVIPNAEVPSFKAEFDGDTVKFSNCNEHKLPYKTSSNKSIQFQYGFSTLRQCMNDYDAAYV